MQIADAVDEGSLPLVWFNVYDRDVKGIFVDSPVCLLVFLPQSGRPADSENGLTKTAVLLRAKSEDIRRIVQLCSRWRR